MEDVSGSRGFWHGNFYLGTRGNASDFHPAESEVKQACKITVSEMKVESVNPTGPSIASPFLSNPAASPTGFDICVPQS